MLKVVLIGPESSGKTSLAKQLAAHYETNYVPEFARDYLTQLNRPYTYKDVLHIANKQQEKELQLEALQPNVLFYDTDLINIKHWLEIKYNKCPLWIHEAIGTRKADLYLLLQPDLPWESDPLREFPNQADRNNLFDIYEQDLQDLDMHYTIINGPNRTKQAIKCVDVLLGDI